MSAIQIDAHAQHYLLPAQTPLLSDAEHAYLSQHTALLATHYAASFLAAFPPKLRRLDDRGGAGGVGMVEGPDMDSAVFVRCLGTLGLREGDRGRRGLRDEDEDEDMRRGEERGDGVVVSGGYGSVAGEGGRRGDGGGDEGGRGEERVIRMRRGDVWMVRWSAVREVVVAGECELL